MSNILEAYEMLSLWTYNNPETGTRMPENILQIKCMVLAFTGFQTGIRMRLVGMNEEDKGLVCILSETVTLNLVTGITGISQFQSVKVHFLLDHLLSFLMPKSLNQYRKQDT